MPEKWTSNRHCLFCGRLRGMAPKACPSRAHERYYALEKERAKRLGKRLHKATIRLLGGKCTKCGEHDIRVLQVNHLTETYRVVLRNTAMYRAILSGKVPVKDFDVRCANDNLRYEYEIGRRV